jgi:hypothetical protein
LKHNSEKPSRLFLSMALAGIRDALPSYFSAISFWCQANKVSGVTMVATPTSSLRANVLALTASRTALVMVGSHSATEDLLPKNSILLQKVLDELLLRLVHPSGNGNNHKLNGSKTERMREEYHLVPKSCSYRESIRSSFLTLRDCGWTITPLFFTAQSGPSGHRCPINRYPSATT